MSNARLVIFSEQNSAVEPSIPEAGKILSGHPAQTVRNHYSDSSGQFFCGEWTGEAGKWKVAYNEEEFCYVTRGRVIVTNAEGEQHDIRGGTAFVVPAGFTGTWDVIEPVHKFYVIYDRK